MADEMPAFRDQGDPSVVWVWDAEAKDYAPKRLNHQPERSWSSGGDNDLFDPAVHRFKPKNPLQEGILAKKVTGDDGGYQGWTNWDTWHVKLLMDNERGLHDASRQIVRGGLERGQTLQQIEEQLAQWAIQTILGPHNKQALLDAQEWNDIPREERVDPHLEELRGQNPEAAGIVENLFGPNVEDTDPMVMDEAKINWYEIVQSIMEDEIEEWRYQQGHDWRSEERPEWAPSETLTLPEHFSRYGASWADAPIEQQSNEPGVLISDLKTPCDCDAENMPHEWQPSWGCPSDGPVPVQVTDWREPPPLHTSDGPFPAKVPRENTQKRDPSFPSMSLSSAPVTDETMPDFPHFLARLEYEDKLAADLHSCPNCAAPMRDMGREMVCPQCGHKQPIMMGQNPAEHLLEATREPFTGKTGAALGLGLVGRLMGGAMTPGAMPGAVGMLGRGALMGVGENMIPGVPGTPEEQDLPMLPVQSVAKTAGGWGAETMHGGPPGRMGGDPAETYRELRLQGVPAGTAMQQVAAEFFNGDVATAQYEVGRASRLTGKVAADDDATCPRCGGHAHKGEEDLAYRCEECGHRFDKKTAASDEEVGLATKNRGDDDNPEHKTQGFNEEHGDSPELLKDVELVGDASREGEDSGLDEDSGAKDDAMKAFHANLPLVIEFASSDEAGQDHPVLKALDELLESVFPGYKGSDDGDEAEADSGDEPEHETKEAAAPMGVAPDPNAGLTTPGQPVAQPGVVTLQDTCPVDGAPPGVPCAHKVVTQGAATPGVAAPGIPGVSGIQSQVPHPTMANVDETFNKHSARKPKMCPYHRDLVDYSLELGDPTQALSALPPNGYGAGWCKSGQFEGSCNFRAPMVTQAYWDAKDAEYAERAEQRRLEQEALQTRVPEVEVQPEPEIEFEVPDMPQEGVQQVAIPEDDGQGSSLEGAPSAVGVGVSAFSKTLERRTAHAPYDLRGDKGEAPRRSRKISMFEMLSEEDMTGVIDRPTHILADKDGENLSDDAPKTESEAHEKRDVPEHHHSPAEHPVDEPNRENATIHDSEGMPLQEGEDYLMKSPNYEIPDKITVQSIDGDRITYTVHTDLAEYQDEGSVTQLLQDGLVFINDTTNSRVTDSSESAFGDELPPRPDAVGGPGEQTDLSRLPTPVSKMVEARQCGRCKGSGKGSDGETCEMCGGDGQVNADLDKLDDPDFFSRQSGAEHLKEFQFKKKDAESEEVEEEAVVKTAAPDLAVVNDQKQLIPLPDENMEEPDISVDEIKEVKPLSRAEAMANPEMIATAGTEYVAKFEGDDPSARDWLFEGKAGGVDIDPRLAAKYAGKNFTPREQREFIDESGTARNLDKLNLADTHYIEEDDLDTEFLFGRRG